MGDFFMVFVLFWVCYRSGVFDWYFVFGRLGE